MKIICWMFGHSPQDGCCGPGTRYFKVQGSAVDGCGTKHLYMETECRRCGEVYRVGNVHVPKK